MASLFSNWETFPPFKQILSATFKLRVDFISAKILFYDSATANENINKDA